MNEWEDPWDSIFDRSPDMWNHAYVLNPREFEAYLGSVKNESFDDGKINLILSSAQTMYFTSQQVKEIIETFSFDDNKLKIAKNLYHKTIDLKNFFIVYDAFSFNSTKNELKDYILKHR